MKKTIIAVVIAMSISAPAHAFGWSDIKAAVSSLFSGGPSETITYSGTVTNPKIIATSAAPLTVKSRVEQRNGTFRFHLINVGYWLDTGWIEAPSSAQIKGGANASVTVRGNQYNTGAPINHGNDNN